MKNFLAVYTGTPESKNTAGWNALSDAQRKERTHAGIEAWGAWMKANEKRIVVAGGPIGKTRRVSPAGIEAAHNNICGYVVVAAESHEEAASLFTDHPHFAIFPGEAVEVMECLPIPGA